MGRHPLTDEEKVSKGLCPACGEKNLHFGPQGGASTNFACFSCRTRYNAAFIPGQGILFLERTGAIDEVEKRYFRKATIEEDAGYLE